MFNILKTLFIVLFAAFLVSCSATTKSESTGQYLDSTAITARVKAHLIDELGTKAFAVKVKTYKDKVQLSGFVKDENIKKRAGTIAGKVSNVKQVINNIIVR